MARTRRDPRPRDAGATRRTLLDAAAAAFAEHGFAGARVDAIAARAGVNKALIYAYFGDKEALYREVLATRLAAPEASRAVDAAADPRAALEALVRWYFRLLSEDRDLARLLAWDLLEGGRRGSDMLAEAAAPTLELVAGLVRRGVDEGALRGALDPEMFRSTVVALCLGYALQRPVVETLRARAECRFSDAEFLDHACALLFDGGGALPLPPRAPRASDRAIARAGSARPPGSGTRSGRPGAKPSRA